jgi:hypothetical protein
MKIAFTICSNNFLAQAKTLGDSLIKYNPDYTFIIGLCDERSKKIDYTFFDQYIIIAAKDLAIPRFKEMCARYTVSELNTSIRPFLFAHLFKIYKDADIILYLDPDMRVYHGFDGIEKEIEGQNGLLTPHITTPFFLENSFLNTGIYNMGFFALKRSSETNKLLSWWGERLEEYCIYNSAKGFFVDQLWATLFPVFFKNIIVSKNLGLNMAYWNFYERSLSTNDAGEYLVNQNQKLIFFHFSGFKSPENRPQYPFEYNDIIKKIVKNYFDELIANNYRYFSKIPCVYKPSKLAQFKYLYSNNFKKKKNLKSIAILLNFAIPEKIFISLKRFINVR